MAEVRYNRPKEVQDTDLEALRKFAEKAAPYRNPILAGIGIILAVWAYTTWHARDVERRRSDGWSRLGGLVEVAEIEDFIRENGDTTAGAFARLQLADKYYEETRFGECRDALREILDDKGAPPLAKDLARMRIETLDNNLAWAKTDIGKQVSEIRAAAKKAGEAPRSTAPAPSPRARPPQPIHKPGGPAGPPPPS